MSFLIVVLLVGACTLFCYLKERKTTTVACGLGMPIGVFLAYTIPLGVIIGGLNLLNTYLSGVLPSVVVFPAINGGAIYAYSSKNDAIGSNGSSGITINGGVIVALGLKTPECAFDCDQNPFKIRGGILVGLGTSNFSSPTNCTQ